MRKAVLAAMISGVCAAAPAQAVEVEVIHWWTSGGEQAAVSVFANEFNQLGDDQWVDTAIAGAENARSTTMQRILGGDAPAAAQFNTSRQFEELIEADLLLDLTDLANKEGWFELIRPSSIMEPCMKDGRLYCVPVNIHSEQWLWTNLSVYERAELPQPKTWKDVIDSAEKFREIGVVPMALGGQGWQENLTFSNLVIGYGGKELFEKVWRDKDVDAANSDEMKAVFSAFGTLRSMVDEGSPGRNWNDATNMVITGKAAFQVMGDWAQGEFALANQVAGEDYGCVMGPSTQPMLQTAGDSFIFPKTRDAELEAAQLKMASMMVSPSVQVAFNSAKGSLPVRADVDMNAADVCMQKGLEALKNPDSIVAANAAYVSSDTNGQIQDLVSQYWNTPSMSADDAVERFGKIIASAD